MITAKCSCYNKGIERYIAKHRKGNNFWWFWGALHRLRGWGWVFEDPRWAGVRGQGTCEMGWREVRIWG